MGNIEVIQKLKSEIIIPIIALLFALALVVFIWGGVQYIWQGTEPGGREKGRQHMLWGVVGIAIMLSAFGIITFLFNTVTDNGRAKGIDGNAVPAPPVVKNGHL